MSSKVVLKSDSSWIVAEVPELPGCFRQGKDETEARTNIQEAIAAWLWAEDQKTNQNAGPQPD
jgi:predicted RNase H-like HicB family nuclease